MLDERELGVRAGEHAGRDFRAGVAVDTGRIDEKRARSISGNRRPGSAILATSIGPKRQRRPALCCKMVGLLMRIRISRPIFAVQLALCHAACGSDAANTPGPSAGGSSGSGGASAGSGGSSAGSAGSGGSGSPGLFAECGGKIVDSQTGTVNADEYRRQARLWDRRTIDCRLGPKFVDLHPGDAHPRATAYEPEHKPATGGHCVRPTSSAGPAAEIATTAPHPGRRCTRPTTAPAPARSVQNYADEKGVICESIQSGGWLGGPHPDPGLPAWTQALGRAVLLPNGFSQTEYWQTNAGITIFPDGLAGATGNQTSGDSKPDFELPKNKVPTAVAVSSIMSSPS